MEAPQDGELALPCRVCRAFACIRYEPSPTPVDNKWTCPYCVSPNSILMRGRVTTAEKFAEPPRSNRPTEKANRS